MLIKRSVFSAMLGIAIAAASGPDASLAGVLTVTAVEPAPRILDAPVDAPIVIHFDKPVDKASIVLGQSLGAFARWSGAVSGSITFSNDDKTVTLAPDRTFSAGEMVMVVLSHDVAATDGTTLRPAGYCFTFWTNARPAALDFSLVQTLTTNGPGESSRPYGGFASDVNGDGFLDITTINEDTADMRVLLNKAEGDGTYDPFLEPSEPLAQRASPSEPTDFNGDGIVDVCVANIDDNSVSILLGNGDGTFAPQQKITVGSAPRGIAVLDVDGDGDMDIVNTNSAGGGNLSLLINDGSGVFGAPGFFNGGGTGEWALAVADMNEDGILDLVVGARSSTQILVHLGNGDGTFTHVETQSSGGAVWMLNCGDVNGDGHEDVATANSSNNVGAILLGDGTGQPGLPTTYPTDSFPLATDLGDIDGDGDLDWVTSSFGGDWRLYVNDGAGNFTFDQEFNAPSNASCALMLDIDNDGDLDLALIDEIADVVIIEKNSGTAPALGDVNDDCHIDLADHFGFVLCLTGPAVCAPDNCRVFDFNDDCDVDAADFARFATNFTGPEADIPGCLP